MGIILNHEYKSIQNIEGKDSAQVASGSINILELPRLIEYRYRIKHVLSLLNSIAYPLNVYPQEEEPVIIRQQFFNLRLTAISFQYKYCLQKWKPEIELALSTVMKVDRKLS